MEHTSDAQTSGRRVPLRVSVPEVFLHPGAHGYREENHGHRFRGGVAGVAGFSRLHIFASFVLQSRPKIGNLLLG